MIDFRSASFMELLFTIGSSQSNYVGMREAWMVLTIFYSLRC